MFSIEEYSRALDRFICDMEGVKDMLSPDIRDIIADLCRILRVGKIDVVLYDTAWHENMKNGKYHVMYSEESFDPQRSVSMREVIGNGSRAVYTIYQRAGEEDWNKQELEKISIVQKVLFTFNGRSNLMSIAEKLTYTDSQLGIYNLTFFIKNLGKIIEDGEIGRYAACYFNLKRFSVVNNQVGRDAGTVIMKKFIDGLQSMFDKDEHVCRIGGDNFAAVFKKTKLDSVIRHLSGTVVTDVEHETAFIISAYQGYYMIPEGKDIMPTDIMDRIGVAQSIAKKNCRAPYIMYNHKVRDNVNRAKMVENLFPQAIRNEEFLVYYQPKVDLYDNTIVGAEALCRWQHEGKIISPAGFIPVLERSKLICELDFYMLEHVCRDIRRWLDEGKEVVKISVNLSRNHLGDVNILGKIMNIISRNNVPHKYIEVELTETATEIDYAELKKIVCGLMEQGISTSVDDFGMGYSSLNLIRELPWNTLKIDKSFLPKDDSMDYSKNRSVLKYVIAMARDIGLECIAEGVETQQQVDLIKENKCNLAQGFFFSMPLPKSNFEQKLIESRVM